MAEIEVGIHFLESPSSDIKGHLQFHYMCLLEVIIFFLLAEIALPRSMP